MATRSSSNILLASFVCFLLPYSGPSESDQCGDMECIFVPTNCQVSNSCQMTLCYKRLTDTVLFDVSYEFNTIKGKSPTNKYIAVGVSETQSMDDISLAYCRFPFEDPPAVGLGYTVQHRLHHLNDLNLVKRNVQLIEALSMNNTKSCKFIRRIVPIQLSNKIKPLDDFYYLVVAVGDLDASGLNLRMHDTDITSKDYPFISTGQVNLSAIVCPGKLDSTNRLTTDLPAIPTPKFLKMLHGSFMIVAWWFFSATAVLSARFLKQHKPEREFFGVKFWFLVHRSFNAVAFLLCLSAFVLVFVAASGKWAGTEFPNGIHAILGMTASVGMFLQPTLAYFRPPIQDSRRPVFKYMHGTIGYGILLCASAAIYMITFPPFGYNFNQDGRYGIAPQVLIIMLIVCFVATAICLEVNRIYTHVMLHRKTARSTRHILKLESLPLKLIVLYMVIATIICTALITFIFL